MSFKTVLSVVGVDQSERDAQAAIDLCAEINAHLSILVVAMAAPLPAGEYAAIVSDAWLQQNEAENAKLKTRAGQLTALVSNAGLSSDVDSAYPEAAWADEVIGQRARYADLMVIGPDLMKGGELKSRAINGGLFESGRPLLAIPEGAKPTLRPKNVLLAWDSRFEAARAAREAIDLMVGANSVHVTLVDPEPSSERGDPEPGADVAAYLARHGIKVTVDRLPSAGAAIADVLRQHAVDIAADVIVMGAYGHSRLRERIFGGVTRSMIDEATAPLFMAH